MRKIISISLAAVFLLSGCSLFQKTPMNSAATQTVEIPPTLTPFQALPPTATPSSVPPAGPTATATYEPNEADTYGFDLGLPRPEGQINILLLGSDKRKDEGFRTDTILVLSLNPQNGTARLLSLPRDLYVMIPDYGYERINESMEIGGFELIQSTLSENFDIPVDYYMMTNFTGFKTIIDTLGGITVNAAYDMKDTCKLPQAINGECYIYAGENLMNGATALWYARSRYSTSDYDRTRRAQEVIIAVFKKIMSLDAVNRSSEIYAEFVDDVETNIDLATIVNLLPFGVTLLDDPSIIQSYAIGANNTSDYIVPVSGAMVLLPDNQSIQEIIRTVIYQ